MGGESGAARIRWEGQRDAAGYSPRFRVLFDRAGAEFGNFIDYVWEVFHI